MRWPETVSAKWTPYEIDVQSDSWRTEDANHSPCCGGGATGSSWTEKPCRARQRSWASLKTFSHSWDSQIILKKCPNVWRERKREKKGKSEFDWKSLWCWREAELYCGPFSAGQKPDSTKKVFGARGGVADLLVLCYIQVKLNTQLLVLEKSWTQLKTLKVCSGQKSGEIEKACWN